MKKDLQKNTNIVQYFSSPDYNMLHIAPTQQRIGLQQAEHKICQNLKKKFQAPMFAPKKANVDFSRITSKTSAMMPAAIGDEAEVPV